MTRAEVFSESFSSSVIVRSFVSKGRHAFKEEGPDAVAEGVKNSPHHTVQTVKATRKFFLPFSEETRFPFLQPGNLAMFV